MIVRVVSSSVTVESGGQCVVIPGEVTMPMWCAGSLDSEISVISS